MSYGDATPEDAWHPADPVPVLLDNLARRCARLGEPVAVDVVELVAVAEAVRRLLIRRHELDDLAAHLVDLLRDDLTFLELREAAR